jgi:hypothetical protein
MVAFMEEDFPFIFIKSTPERRTGVLRLKLMFDEAHRLREAYNIEAYANQIAEIVLAYARLNPRYAEKISQKEKSAAFIRSMGKAPDYPAPNWREDRFAYLDRQLNFSAEKLVCFEEEIRLGFSAEMENTALELTKFI